MAFFYVKAGGAATGDGGRSPTARTGPWTATTSEYYATLSDALAATTAPTAGDYILWSDESSDTIVGDTNVDLPIGVHVCVVDNDDVASDAVASSPLIDNASSDYYQIRPATNATEPSVYSGGLIKSGASVGYTRTSAHFLMKDCVYEHTGNTSNYILNGRSAVFKFYDCTFRWTNPGASGEIFHATGSSEFFNTTFSFGDFATHCIETSSDGPQANYWGCDFSIAPAAVPLIKYKGSVDYNASQNYFVGCKLATGWVVSNTSVSAATNTIVESCDNVYQWFQESKHGTIDFVTDVYYTAHDTLDDRLTKGSFEFETSSAATSEQILQMGSAFHSKSLSAINTEVATKKKVRIRMATATGDTIDDADIFFLVMYPTTGATYRTSIVKHWQPGFVTGSALPTETGAWTGAGLGTQYYFDIDMGNPGSGRVMVIPGITKPNVTVYVSWQLEFVA